MIGFMMLLARNILYLKLDQMPMPPQTLYEEFSTALEKKAHS
jgi:hypothetical protein